MNELIERCKAIARGIYKELGSEFEECVYHKAFEVMLRLGGIDYESKKVIPIYYKEYNVGENEADLVVYGREGRLVVELKTIKDPLNNGHEAQLRKYLETLEIDTGLLVNFRKTSKGGISNEPEFIILQ